MAKRRANGEGNIRKRSDGRWEGRYTAGRDPDTGKVIYKNVLAKTQKECKEKLQRAIKENAKVDTIRAEQYTVGRWMDVWFENCAKIKVRPSSHKTYQGYIDNHIKPSIGKIPLGKLSSLDLQKLYKRLLIGGRVERIESQKQPKGLSAKTVRNINQVISSAMDFAIDQKLIVTNPTDGCALPKLEHREMKTLPTEQLASFLHEARESGVYELYYIELATGLRRGELLGLKWEDIDFSTNTIRIKRTISRISNPDTSPGQPRTILYIRTPKSHSSAREIPIPQYLIAPLAEMKTAKNRYLLTGQETCTEPRNVQKKFKTILKHCHMQDCNFHAMRHGFATACLEKGIDCKTVSSILGHASTRTTMDFYVHTSMRQKKSCIDSIE